MESTEGTIVDIYECSSDTYAPVIEYYDAYNDATYQFTHTTYCDSIKPTVGKSIRVLYDPEIPGEGLLGSFSALWLLPIITLSAAGIAFIVTIACVCKFFYRRDVVELPQNMNPAYFPNSNSNEYSTTNTNYNNAGATTTATSTNNSTYAGNTGGTTSLFDEMKLNV